MNTLKLIGPSLLIAFLAACSNPADKVPEAKVSATNAPAKSEAAAPSAASKTYSISAANSKVEFVGSKVTGSHNGGFTNFNGELHVVGGKLSGSGKVVIETASLYADNDRLTGHLKSPDFFDVAKFPTAIFEATSATVQGTNTTISGNLTLHGITKQISFPANVQVSDGKVDLTSEFFINRFDFEMKYPGKADDLIRKEVVLKLNVHATPGSGKVAAK